MNFSFVKFKTKQKKVDNAFVFTAPTPSFWAGCCAKRERQGLNCFQSQPYVFLVTCSDLSFGRITFVIRGRKQSCSLNM